jgi:hypothetical protein
MLKLGIIDQNGESPLQLSPGTTNARFMQYVCIPGEIENQLQLGFENSAFQLVCVIIYTHAP